MNYQEEELILIYLQKDINFFFMLLLKKHLLMSTRDQSLGWIVKVGRQASK
jgi:hypothetical protein